MRIAMWSGPRNLSTAMMYAFAARGDCAVMDEPFYAAYLARTGLLHPMRDAILAAQPTDPARVVAQLLHPLRLGVLERRARGYREADEEDIGLRVGQWAEPVIILLPSRVP